jgi:hypothetical protein
VSVLCCGYVINTFLTNVCLFVICIVGLESIVSYGNLNLYRLTAFNLRSLSISCKINRRFLDSPKLVIFGVRLLNVDLYCICALLGACILNGESYLVITVSVQYNLIVAVLKSGIRSTVAEWECNLFAVNPIACGIYRTCT